MKQFLVVLNEDIKAVITAYSKSKAKIIVEKNLKYIFPEAYQFASGLCNGKGDEGLLCDELCKTCDFSEIEEYDGSHGCINDCKRKDEEWINLIYTPYFNNDKNLATICFSGMKGENPKDLQKVINFVYEKEKHNYFGEFKLIDIKLLPSFKEETQI
jgi:hypothetical protein